MVNAGLIVTAVIIPLLLLLANLVLLAKYIDPQHAAGHYLSKGILVTCRWIGSGGRVLFGLSIAVAVP